MFVQRKVFSDLPISYPSSILLPPPSGWLSLHSSPIILFIDLFLAVLGLCCCPGSSLVVTSRTALPCSTQASHCSGFSCSGARALGHTGFRSCHTWAQQLSLPGSRVTGSVVVAHGLICSSHVGFSQIRDQTPCLLHGQADSLPLSHQGSAQPVTFFWHS